MCRSRQTVSAPLRHHSFPGSTDSGRFTVLHPSYLTPMKRRFFLILGMGSLCLPLFSAEPATPSTTRAANEEEFKVVADQFADIQVLRYRVPGFDQLSLQQKKLAYYLTEAGLAGRDIFYDQK